MEKRKLVINDVEVEITTDGRIFEKGVELKQHNQNGYKQVRVGKAKKMVHCLVAAAFCVKPLGVDEKNLVVHHVDNNRSNNCVSNLEFMSRDAHTMLHQRQQVAKKARAKQATGVLGVYHFPIGRKSYRAAISDFNKKVFTLGYFKSIQEASRAFELAKAIRLSKNSFTKDDVNLVKQQLKMEVA